MESILNNRRSVAVKFTDEDVIVTLLDETKVSNPLLGHWWLEQATPESVTTSSITATAWIGPTRTKA